MVEQGMDNLFTCPAKQRDILFTGWANRCALDID